MKKLTTETFYSQLLKYFIKNGKKSVAKKVVTNMLLKLSALLNERFSIILKKLILSLNVFIELKNVRMKKHSSFVPFPINANRRLYLIIKWLSMVVKSNKKKVPLCDKLVTEIYNTVLGTPLSETLKIKLSQNQKILENKSNIHYRW
jgi:ribosomal protein S7